MTLHFDPDRAQGVSRAQYFAALGAEGVPIGETYPPVYRSPLLNLYDTTSPIPFRDPALIQDYARLQLPNTERAVTQTGAVLPHTHLLGDDVYISQLIEAVRKVNANLDAVARHFA
jgi:dTDP-4-amino-4,6-dideoxygalactose transaminase